MASSQAQPAITSSHNDNPSLSQHQHQQHQQHQQQQQHQLQDDDIFDEGDVTLRTRDGTTFRVYSNVLRNSSTFFASMFSLPLPVHSSGLAGPSSSSSQQQQQQLQQQQHVMGGSSMSDPIIVDDDVVDLRIVLQMISGRAFSSDIFNSLDRIKSLLHLIDKYGMRGPMSILRSSVLRPTILTSHPLELYSLSCQYDWPDVARLSALESLNYDLTSPSSFTSLKGLSLPHYARLLSLARRRREKFNQALNDSSIFQGSAPGYLCRNCQRPAGDLTWKVLRMQLGDMMERCPSGRSVREEGVRDGSTNAAWMAMMNAKHCSNFPLYAPDSTRETILRILDGLPDSLDAW